MADRRASRDSLVGNAGSDQITGLAGNDRIHGRAARLAYLSFQRLDTGAVSHAKELESLRHELDSLAKRQGDLEEVVLENGNAMGHTSHLSEADRRALVAWLETL